MRYYNDNQGLAGLLDRGTGRIEHGQIMEGYNSLGYVDYTNNIKMDGENCGTIDRFGNIQSGYDLVGRVDAFGNLRR